MNNESPANIIPGTIIASRYEVIRELGFGAMGDVYMCKHKDLGDHAVWPHLFGPDGQIRDIAIVKSKTDGDPVPQPVAQIQNLGVERLTDPVTILAGLQIAARRADPVEVQNDPPCHPGALRLVRLGRI